MNITINNKEQNEIKAIQVDDYFVIIDTKAKIKEDDVFLGLKVEESHKDNNWIVVTLLDKKNYVGSGTFVLVYKIIATTKFIDKSIPVIKFVEQSIKEILNTYYYDGSNGERIAFLHGLKYNRAKSSDKKWRDEDLKYMFECGRNYQNNAEITFKTSMDYLNQPKLPDTINLEMEWISGIYSHEDCKSCNGDGGHNNTCVDCRGHGSNINTISEPYQKLKTTSTPEEEEIQILI